METRPEPEASKISTRQPGALTSTTVAIERPGLYRAGMHTELLKFGSRHRLTILDPEPEPAQVTGLDLTLPQDKALQAIQILLDKTKCQGNRPGAQALSPGYTGLPVPRLALSYSDYFDAYGLKRRSSAGGWTKLHQEALEALHALAEPRWRIAYKRRRWVGAGKSRKAVYDVIAPEEPISLITILKAYEGLQAEEVDRLERGEKLPGREKGLLIDCHPVLIDQISTFAVLKPKDLHQEIQRLSPGKRPSRTISLFIEWLLTLDMASCSISEDRLLEKLRLHESFYRHRNKGRIRKQLLEAFETASTLGYLLEWQKLPTGSYVFAVNPDRCRRVKEQQLLSTPGGEHGEP